MRVVIAPDRFAGSLTAAEAAEAIATGWRARAPHDDLDLVPLSDGGSGFLDVLAPAVGGEMLAATVRDPLGTPVPATVLLADRSGVPTAYLEAAQACGPHLVRTDRRDPTTTTSAGLGDLLALALGAGARRIVVGVGEVVTHDAGAGLLAALGAGPGHRLARGGLALGDLTSDDLAGLAATVDRFRGIELLLATADDLPLLGLQGASAVEAQERGATPEQAQELERAFGHLVGLVRRIRPERTDLLTGVARRLDKEAGAGAAGGIGWALFQLGGRRTSAVQVVAEAVGLRARLAGADLVVTGEGSFDWRSLRDRVVAAVAEAALDVGVPSIVLAGEISVGRREAMAAGLSGTYAVADRPVDLAAVLADPAGALSARAARVAGTWSPAG
ncbi:glycerate kinase [Lapillicoccus sp.]|uniref:glycerate kinase n=1 Tax=Lapillicoccus sp. TaxID=1909287 RepID=UPI0025F62F41|nr:glycerate kinase [Lapillicoccus sp.]